VEHRREPSLILVQRRVIQGCGRSIEFAEFPVQLGKLERAGLSRFFEPSFQKSVDLRTRAGHRTF
jgi:hypothetical protein